MSAWPFATDVEVRFNECDPAGHVNNAVYLTYFEAARFAYWRRVNGPLPAGGPGFILARMEVDYRAPAYPGDVLEVRVRVAAIGRTSFTIASEIVRRADAALIAESRAVLVVYDYAAGRPMPMPDTWRAALEREGTA